MRLILLHNRLHRAFPELDPYTDERCRTFVKAAQGGLIRRAINVLIVLLVALATLAAGGLATAWAAENWFNNSRSTALITPDMWVLVAFLIATPTAAYLARDLLLRRRLRWVLRTRGVCPKCRYSLIGLPVSAGNFVTCPECAHQTEVDPSLGELTIDDSGLGRFQPSERALPQTPRFFTPARVRILERAAIIAALILGIGLPALWGGYELWLRRQAATARSERPGPDAIAALIDADQPPGSEGGANAWEPLQRALDLRDQAEQLDVQQHPLPPDERDVYSDFSSIYIAPPPDDAPEEWRQRDAQMRATALRLVEAYRKAGVYEALDGVARAPRAVVPMSGPSGEPLATIIENPGSTRVLASINAARMALAQEAGDLPEYVSAVEANFALARVESHEPFLWGALHGVHIELLTYDRLNALLVTHPSAEWLDAIDAAIARQRPAPRPQFPWESGRLVTLDTLAWTFSDPDRVHWGRLSIDAQDMFSLAAEETIGTYPENRDALNGLFREAAVRAPVPRWQRPASARFARPPALVQSLLSPDLGNVLRAFDRDELVRRGYNVEAALERHYAAEGAYPDSLAALVPSFLTEAPIDPWTGKPFVYRLRAPDAPAEDTRGYLLYSIGSDGTDDGGRRGGESSGGDYAALRDDMFGCDFIINDWTPAQ